jgi:hypothetical protein
MKEATRNLPVLCICDFDLRIVCTNSHWTRCLGQIKCSRETWLKTDMISHLLTFLPNPSIMESLLSPMQFGGLILHVQIPSVHDQLLPSPFLPSPVMPILSPLRSMLPLTVFPVLSCRDAETKQTP